MRLLQKFITNQKNFASENEFLKIPDPANPRFSYSGSKIIGEILTFNYRDTKTKHNIFRPHNVFDQRWDLSMSFSNSRKNFKASNKFNLKKVFNNHSGKWKRD